MRFNIMRTEVKIKNIIKRYIRSSLFLFILIFIYYNLDRFRESGIDDGKLSIYLGLFAILLSIIFSESSTHQLDGTIMRLDDTQTQLINTQEQLRNIQIDYWNARGVDQRRNEEPDAAIQSYDKAISINQQAANRDPLYAKVWLNRANALLDLGKNLDAFRDIKKAYKLNPENVKILDTKRIILHTLGKNNEAAEDAKQAIEMNSKLPGIWINTSKVYLDLNRYDEALTAANRAIQIDPDFAEAWGNKGIALLKKGKWDEAIEAFDKAIELKPKYATIWYDKGYVFSSRSIIPKFTTKCF